MSDSPEPRAPFVEEPKPEGPAPGAKSGGRAGGEDRPGDPAVPETAVPELAPPTERPVPSPRPLLLSEGTAATRGVPARGSNVTTSEYVLTVDDATGQVTAFERLDRRTGERRPLTNEEYALASTYAAIGASGGLMAAVPGLSVGIAQVYYAGVLDYLNTLTRMAKTPG